MRRPAPQPNHNGGAGLIRLHRAGSARAEIVGQTLRAAVSSRVDKRMFRHKVRRIRRTEEEMTARLQYALDLPEMLQRITGQVLNDVEARSDVDR